MGTKLLGIPNIDVYLVMGILLFFIFIEVIGGYLHQTKRKSGDWIQELGSFLLLSLATKPFIVLAVLFLGNTFFPQAQYVLNGYSLWLLLPLYLFVDDLLQYWYHRSAHEYPFLWKLHRTHHQAEEMGFFVSYRNAAVYYLFMPNIWWMGLISFLGGGIAVSIGLILKQIVIIGAHSTIKWDKPFYKNKFLSPFISLIERIIITPAFHHAHHGKSKLDTVSDPNGNFGNMFSIWDQLFGTASFTRQFPKEYGLQTPVQDHWSAAYLYPFVHSKDEKSELSKSFTKSNTSSLEPIFVNLIEGENYLWCKCGKSKSQPFCDGSHHGSKIKPILFQAKRTGRSKICNCKKSKIGPFCDNTHLKF